MNITNDEIAIMHPEKLILIDESESEDSFIYFVELYSIIVRLFIKMQNTTWFKITLEYNNVFFYFVYSLLIWFFVGFLT